MASKSSHDDDLAYGDYHGGPDHDTQDTDRGFFGDVYHRLRPQPAQGQVRGSSSSPPTAYRTHKGMDGLRQRLEGAAASGEA